ncbi:DNA alkylation repair protein [Rickettsia endosymbiont of Gonocerus acuteangulatus]|uniref:DNA alkylation repair protein n=1 Tax=Rickettsia endosymbiont of Gonocerus acuteangulatus TaxID=3066266 RepID=UPI003132E1D4
MGRKFIGFVLLSPCIFKSENLWERRIAMVATWYFIRKNELDLTFKIAQLLLNDKHDLIHKAVGWMLREAGKKDEKQLIEFLNRHISQMPRTTLRYAIERFMLEIRRYYILKN